MMLIHKKIYKGYSYEIHLNQGDWGNETGKFRVEGNGFLNVQYNTDIEKINTETEKQIDNRLDKALDLNDMYNELSNCIVRTGYEDCELDKTMVLSILEKYKEQILKSN